MDNEKLSPLGVQIVAGLSEFCDSIQLSDFDKLKRTFDEIGIPYVTADDSEEYEELAESLDSVIILGMPPNEVFICFHADDSYKEMFQWEDDLERMEEYDV